MPTIAEIKAQYPDLGGLDDNQVVDALHQAFYQDLSRDDVANALGIKPPASKPEGAGVFRTLGDMAIKGAQGAVDLGASAVGIGNLLTGGMVGKGMDAVGYDPQRTNATMGEYLSDAQKASDAKVQNAQGFFDTVGQAVTEPRFLAGSLMESLPGILALGGVQGAAARAIAGKAALSTAEGSAAAIGKAGDEAVKAALATKTGAEAAKAAIEANGAKLMAMGAGGEGAQTAGQIAQQAQQAGRDYTDYALPAVGAGVMTAAIGAGAGKVMGDAGTKIFTGVDGQSGGLVKRALKSGFSEGTLEETPQSASEQYFTNIAMGEPDRMKGVANSAGVGWATGTAMGLGMGAMEGANNAPTAKASTPPETLLAQPAQPVTPPPVAIAPKTVAPSFSSILDTDYVYKGWSNVQDGSDRSIMRDQMDYVAKTYAPNITPENKDAIKLDLSQQFKWFRAASPAQKDAALDAMAPTPSPADQVRATKVPENGPMTAAVNAGIEQKAQDIESGKQAVIDLNAANEADQSAYEQAMAQQQEQAAAQAKEQDTIDKPVTTGPIAEAQMAPEDKRAMLFSNQPVVDGGAKYEGTQDGDVLNGLGAPFKTKFAALRRAQMEGKDWTIAGVFDGWVARRKDAANVQNTAPAVTTQAEQAPTQAPETARITDSTIDGVPASAGSVDVEGDGVEKPLKQPAATVEQAPVATDGVAKALDKVSNNFWKGETFRDIAPQVVRSPDVYTKKEPKFTGTNLLDAATEFDYFMTDGRRSQKISKEVYDHIQSLKPNNTPATSAQSAPIGVTPKSPSKTDQAKADLDHLFGIDNKRAKAIERIAKGSAYFSKPLKAQEFIAKNGLKDTHKSVKTSPNRWDVVAKTNIVKDSKLPPTNIHVGDVVTKGGNKFTVTGPIDGGISAERTIKQEGGVTETETIFLKGDEAIQAKLDSQPTEKPSAQATKTQQVQAERPPQGTTAATTDKPAADAGTAATGKEGVAKSKKPSLKDRMAQERQARANYFTPGNIVTSYGGHDEVISYTPPKEDGGGWSVKVHAVKNVDGEWVRIGKPQDVRTHSTQPDAQALKDGPLDKAVTPKREVAAFDSLEELDKSVEKADIETKDTTNDPTPTTSTPTLDSPVDEGQRPAGGETPARGAKSSRARKGRGDDGSVRRDGRRDQLESQPSQEAIDNGREDSGNLDGQTGSVAGGLQRVSSDFIPDVGGLTREGSWFEAAKRNIDLIDLAIKIESENRAATPAEQAQLAKYVGFGASAIRNDLFPVPPAYAKSQEPNRLIWPQFVRNDRFKPLAERIEALPREWQQSILQSSQYAHYTSEGIIRSVWSALQRMGFTGGNVFEPGMGIGSFAMLMPNTIRNTSRYTGVEFDAPTALIARLLSPDQNMIHGDFIKKRFPENFFDVNVGNPPFSQTKILGDPKYAKNGFMLHDFFFAKGIDLVRPGGIQVFVTSKGTMDKQNDKARKYLSDRADLLGAIRLPSTAFEDNAGTSVVTDVIFLRKRAPGEAAAGQSWAGTASVETKDGPVLVNEYFAKYPEMVLGQQRISGNTDDMGRRINSNGIGGEKYTVVSYDTTAAELDAKFAQAIEKLPENAYSVMGQSSQSIRDETAKIDFDPSVKREGVIYAAKDGAIMRVEQGVGKPLESMVKLSDKDKAWLKGYVGLRDLVQESRFAQLNDGDWAKSLAKLNKAHDAFIKEHGNIQDYRIIARKSTDEDGNVITSETRVRKNKRLFSEDYDQALVTSLEEIAEDGTIVKAPFLKGRTIGKPVSRDVRTIGDALAVSLDERGTLNLDDVAQRMKLSRDEVIDSLGSQVYQTPTGEWQLADEYLAGDVVAKLEEAEQAARLNPALQRNVDALKSAQPEKLGPSQISAKLGASWIPESHVNEFAQEIGAGSVTFDPKTETWTVQGGNERSARKAGAEYGTAKRSPSELLEAVLNSRSIKITQVIDKKTVQDEEATTAANEMAKKIKDKFKGWIWTNTDRASDLVEGYNKHFNNIAPRRFDGSHLTLPGVSLRYKLHPHQLRAIWRQIQTGNTYLAHAVGAGKTIEMIAGGMEQRRLGLIKKPMYVVPNHMLEQFSNEFMELYPLANIMVADDENFSADRRKAFIASATLNNPDAIIITHDAFQRIGVKEESVAPIRDEILTDLEIELSETAKDNDSRVRRGQLQQQIEAVTQRFDKIIGAGQKDSTIKFEDMGVDFVYADEAHVFRKLDFHTAQSIKGIDPNGSKRALDMYVKTRILEKSKPGRAFTFASGTPVTNTMGELYTIMRFFAGDELDKSGISTFDAWARQFGEVVAALEPNAAGAYQIVERFAKFDNVPELMSRVRQFMDVLTSDNLGALVKRPDLAGGKPNLNIIPANAALTEYMKGDLAKRIEISKAWKPSPDQKGNPDPIVSIITDGRFAAIDPRFFGGTLQNGETSIITEMGDKVASSYHATKNNVYTGKNDKPEAIKGSTQIVFYNLGFGEGAQRSRGFDSRAAFTKRLTDGGIPRNEIAWFDDANTDAKKEAVFKDMRSGKLKVLIGSAKKMGTGVNVQKRLAVLHYQDPPWFPADVEQPHGRIIRQGNQNGTVAIEWYTTKGTYQSTMWQMVGRKQRFIDQAFTGDKTMRSMDDLGEASLFEQAAAVASGDPRAIQLAGLKQDVERFERLHAAHASEQINVRANLNSAKWHVESLQKRITSLSKAFKAIGEKYFSFSAGQVGGREFTKPGEFGQAIKDAFNKVSADSVMSAGMVQDKQIASLGPRIQVKMDASIGKDNKPTGSFDLFVEFGGMSHQLANAAAMGADVDAVGLARRIFNQINSVSSDLSSDRRRLVDEETDVTKLSKKLGAPFEHQQEMAEKYGELKRLEAELKAEGEIKPDVPLIINADGVTPQDRPSFSLGASSTGLPHAKVSSIVNAIRSQWENSPDVVVAASMDDPVIPQSVRDYDQLQKSQGAQGEPDGFVHRGKVYLIADQLPEASDVIRVLFHEALGHKGLRGAYGDGLKPILQQMATMRRKEVSAKANQYGLDMSKESDRLAAAEEVLAEMAQTRPEIGFVTHAVSLIRAWLRKHVPGFSNLALTDNDIIAQFLIPARRFIEGRGAEKQQGAAGQLAFGRGTNEVMTNNDVVGNQGGRSADDTTPGAVPHPFSGFTREQFLGNPKITPDSNAKDLVPQTYRSLESVDAVPFLAGNDMTAKYSDLSASVYNAKGQVIATYSSGDALVVDKKYRRQGIGSELVYQWRMQNPNSKTAATRTKKSQALQEKVWDRIRSERALHEARAYQNESTAPDSGGAMFSRTMGNPLASAANSARNVSLPASYKVGDLMAGEGRLSWWHKTVGTQYHLAQKSPAFKRVYDSIQNFLNDVSFYAAEAADLAPTILPKLDKMADMLKQPLSAVDTKALSRPVFEGTLSWGRDTSGKAVPMEQIEDAMALVSLDDRAHRLVKGRRIDPAVLRMWQGLPQDQYESIINGKFEREFMRPGVVFTPDELKQIFDLTDAQVGLYQEFRKATDKSLDNLTISEMLNYAGDDAAPVRDVVLEAGNVDDAADTLREYLLSLADLEPERSEKLTEAANKMLDIAARTSDLKKQGYAPLSRFGSFTLEAILPTGERYFTMFETDMERNKAARMLRESGATGINAGTMSQEEHKLLKGINPETVALFGDLLGLDSQGSEAKDIAFQAYIKNATANRSAMKRLIHRKGVAGFNEDAGRVLAAFIYSNGRRTSSNLHAKETTKAISDIPKEQGQLKDHAVQLQEYVSNPQEEAQAFRGILFAQYLGGSIASAMVNATQPFTVTLPYLSQFGGIRKSASRMSAAVRDAGKKETGDVRLDAALKKAEEEGIVSPQEVHALQAQAAGRAQLRSGDGTASGNAVALAQNGTAKLMLAWGKVFSVAEQFNRRVTFIAAYRTAVEQGIASPAKFAEKAVAETQFVYNKGNKPRWARGAIGATLFTFKQYSVQYLELVTRMATAGEPGSPERKAGQKAAVLAIAVLFMLSGSDGLPFMDDISDVIDGALQRLGYNFSSKRARKTFLINAIGKDGADFVTNGISGLPGMPIDVSGRMGMNNLIPGTGLLVKKADHTRDLTELLGPTGDLAKRAFNATEQAMSGDVTGAMKTISPVAARNMAKAAEMGSTGMYLDDKKHKIIDTTAGEAIFKAIGFQPASVKDVQEASAEVQKSKAQYLLASGELRSKMAQAIFMQDNDAKQAVRDAVATWNDHNPDQRMSINMPAVLRQVREMHKSKQQRMADTAPKAIRQQVREQLKESIN